MYMQTIIGRYRLYARAPQQGKASLRDWGDDEKRLISEGARLARASISEGGVMSVWVVDTRASRTIWSAERPPTPQPEEE